MLLEQFTFVFKGEIRKCLKARRWCGKGQAWTPPQPSLMANLPSSCHAANRAIVDRHDEALAREEASADQQRGYTFQREKIKEIVDAARIFQDAMERVTDTLTPPSPFSRVPAEILLEIFSHAVKQEVEHRKDQMEMWTSVPFRGVPITLARVCAQWRTIVQQNPILWEQILIPKRSIPMNAQKEDLVKRRVARWKAKGVQHKQSLFIEGWDNKDMERLILLAGSYPGPWRSIDVGIMDSSLAKRWDAESVHATKVKLYHGSHGFSLRLFLPLIQKAGELTIMGMPQRWIDTPLTCLVSLSLLPFANKRGKRTEPLEFGAFEFCQILKTTPCLKELQLDFARTRLQANTPIPNSLEHRPIESISLHLDHISDNMGIFGLQTSMPSLRTLTILSLELGPPVLAETGEMFFGGWDQLRVLSLYGLELAGLARALTLFAHLPKVDTLNVTGPHANALVRLMNIHHRQLKSPAPELLLPQLTKVVLRSTDIQGGTLMDMVQTRLADMRGPAIVRRITVVEMYDTPGVTVEDWKCIQTLLKRGRSLAEIGF